MATIPVNVIFIWTGTHASIPSGWSRETTLDAKYPKGIANGINPGGMGGALTHSHTTPNHNHSTAHVHTVPNSPAGSGSSNRDVNTTNPPATHTHVSNPSTINPTTTLANDTPSTDAINHEPSRFDVIFIKSDGTPTGLPDLAVGLWSNAAGAPASWNLCDGGAGRPDIRNRFAKGAAAAGDGGGTGGSATHEHTIVSHTHSTPYAHPHPDVTSSTTAATLASGSIAGAMASVATATHQHTLTIGSASPVITGNTDTVAASDNQPPYWVLALIQNNAGALNFPDRIIGLWLGTLASIPADWKLCDGSNGTPDLRTLFVKGANVLGDIGGSGGSLTHGAAHTATGHTHAVASHDHTVSAGAGAGENRTAGAVATATAAHTHPSWSNTAAASFTSGAGTPVPDDYTDTQPPYVDVAFIQWQAPAVTPFGAYANTTRTTDAIF